VAQRVGGDRGTLRVEWSASRPGRTLPPGKTRFNEYVYLYQEYCFLLQFDGDLGVMEIILWDKSLILIRCYTPVAV